MDACERCDRTTLKLKVFIVKPLDVRTGKGLMQRLCHGCMAEINEHRLTINQTLNKEFPILNWRRDGLIQYEVK